MPPRARATRVYRRLGRALDAAADDGCSDGSSLAVEHAGEMTQRHAELGARLSRSENLDPLHVATRRPELVMNPENRRVHLQDIRASGFIAAAPRCSTPQHMLGREGSAGKTISGLGAPADASARRTSLDDWIHLSLDGRRALAAR